MQDDVYETVQAAIFLNHTHTPYSIDSEMETRGWHGPNHQTRYEDIIEHTPAGIGVIGVRTEHWYSDPTFFDAFEETIEDAGGTVDRYACHIAGELDGTPFAIINGMEASLEEDHYHFTVGGLPLDYDETHHNDSMDELLDLGREADWIAPAHYAMPGFHIPEDVMDTFFEHAVNDPDITPAINYSTGYTPFLNDLAHGAVFAATNWLSARSNGITEAVLPGGKTLSDYVEAYDVPAVPEIDLHTSLPRGFEGAGIVFGNDPMKRLQRGEIPVDDLLTANVVSRRPGREGLSYPQFVKTYPDVMNMLCDAYDRGLHQFLPHDREEHAAVWAETVDGLQHVSAEELVANTYPPA